MDLFSSDPKAPGAEINAQNLGDLFRLAFPDIASSAVGGIGTLTSGLTDIQEAEGGRRAAAETDTFSQLLSGIAGAERDALQGAGGDVVREVGALNRELDPEFFAGREAGLGSLLNTFGQIGELGKGLSGGEQEQIQRSLNRSNLAGGNLNTPSNLNTVQNAVTFGGAARDRLSQAIGAATNFLPAATSFLGGTRQGVDAKATGVTNPAIVQNAFTGSNLGAPGLDLSQGLLGASGQLTGQTNQINSERMLAGEKIFNTAQSSTSTATDY